jgi:hypothetical protein
MMDIKVRAVNGYYFNISKNSRLVTRMLKFVEVCYEFKAMDFSCKYLAKEDNKQYCTAISRSLKGCECAVEKMYSHLFYNLCKFIEAA